MRRWAARASACTRGFAHEFLSVALGFDASAVVTSFGRVVGVVVMLTIVRISLVQGLAPDTSAAVTQCAFVGVLAIVLGNIAKELAIDLGARVLSWWHQEYRRAGFRLDGSTYSEILYPDGTWFRAECRPTGTVYEWIDSSGACNRIATGTRQHEWR